MSLGERLMNLRKEKHLSQEEVADRLNVTRQTVSKWELDQSTPDLDKIVPLCRLFEISTEELITGNKNDVVMDDDASERENEKYKKEKRTRALVNAIFLYFVAVVWIMITVPVLNMNPVVASGVFLLIIGYATCLIVYTQIMYKKTKKPQEVKEDKIFKQIDEILSIFTCIVYLLVSFITGAWHITWLIWLVYALVIAIIKLLFSIRGGKGD